MILLLIILILILFYFYATKNHGYWAKQNVIHCPPLPFFGNHARNIFGKKSITEISVELYNAFPKEKVVGYYRGTTPELIIRDLDLARQILTVDFSHFYPRGLGRDPKMEALSANLFSVDGDTWKLLRQRLTPAFTTAKLKAMFPLVVQCAEKLQDLGEELISRGGECDVRELMARFTTEFIGACGFGIQMDTINNENSLFRELGKNIFNRSLRNLFLVAIWELVPELRKVIYISDAKVEAAITEIFCNIRAQRNGKASGRNDFIDLLLELETKGRIKGDSIEKRHSDGVPMQVEMDMDVKCMVAQVFVFFAAGFETSSNATSYTLHELAYHPDIQREIQNEIDNVLLKYDNKLNYDSIAEMSLLSMAFKEALRMFPSLGVLHRVCAKEYSIPELNITLNPGVKIMVPIQAIHMDEKYFENPSEFRPQRFAPEAVVDRHSFSYLPFGVGPRACIGMRLGEMQSLAGLAALLQKFTVEPAASSQRKLIVDHTHNVVQGVKTIPLKLKLRKNKSA